MPLKQIDHLKLEKNWITTIENQGFQLFFSNGKLALKKQGPHHPLYIDFDTPQFLKRIEAHILYNDPLTKAFNIKNKNHQHVYDATAGMGSDGFMLSALGYTVTLFEKNPIVHALLTDALARAQLSSHELIREISSRMTLITGEATDCLEPTDIIYLDPMFPTRKKTALPNKAMQWLNEILLLDTSQAITDEMLLNWALAHARTRVVLKRPLKAPKIFTHKISHQVKGKAHRFDIYSVR